MNRFRGRVIAAAIAATTLLTSIASGAAFAAEPLENGLSAGIIAVSGGTGSTDGVIEKVETDIGVPAEDHDAEVAEMTGTEDPEGLEDTLEQPEEQAGGQDTDQENFTGKSEASDEESGESATYDAGSGDNSDDGSVLEESGTAGTEYNAAPVEEEDLTEIEDTFAQANEEEQAFDGDDGLITMPDAEEINMIGDSPADMPEFNEKKKAGKYFIKIHAEEGVFPKQTKVTVKELNGTEAKPYTEKAEQMSDEGMAVAVIDITFTDSMDREIQPNGMVEVTFENAVEDNSTVSVYHAPKADVTKMEELRTDEKGDAVTVQSDSFSPFVLLAAADEPDWTKGGAGTRTDVSDQIQFTQDGFRWHTYSDYDLGDWLTVSYTMKLDGKNVGCSVCLDPRRNGENVFKSEKTYEITAPMLVKAVYYGFDGPGSSVIQEITGSKDMSLNNIVTHVAVSEIYARLGYSSKSKAGDGFIGATAKLRELVKKFVKAIEDLPVPSGYYLYVSANSNGSKQDFGFGSTELVPHEASFTIHKDVNESDATMRAKIKTNSNYNLAGARYGIYKTKGTAAELRSMTPYKSLTVDKNGDTAECIVPPGTYYAVEIKAPAGGGYIMSNSVYTITLSSGEKKKIEVTENYKYVFLRIIKEPKNVPEGTTPPSLAGAVFEIYRDAKRTDLVGTVTTDAGGKSEQLKTDLNGNNLLIQTYYVKEVRPPEGYKAVGDFSISTTPALEADERYMLIDRTVQESVKKAGITIYKRSADPEITGDNKCYTFAGAEFGIYSDEACTQLVETVVTDENGMAETNRPIAVADYWIREIKAPPCYNINEEVFKISREDMSMSESQELTVEDTCKSDPAQIRIIKRAAGGLKANSLEGAEFTFSYYDGYYKNEAELPADPVRSWTIRTLENERGEYTARIADCMQNGSFVSGDEFYTDNQGNPAFPLGTVAITETKAPEGYEKDPDFGGGARMLIGNIVLNSADKAVFIVVQGMEPVENTITVEETPFEPAIRTLAVDGNSRSHTGYAGDGLFRIIDTVTYENLNKNTDYIMSGTLMDKETGKPFLADGKDVTATKKFNTGEEMNGTTDVVFEFECSEEDIKGHILVVKENLKADSSNDGYDSIPGAEHWDIDDKDQTICFPEIGTTLVEKESRSHLVPADSDVELVDTVSYKNLMPGEKYTAIGTLIDRETGQAVMINEMEVSSTATFTADEANGSVEVTFSFHTAGLEGKKLVAFEELTCNGRTVAKHEDIKDEGQTVAIPGVETDAYDKETEKKNSLAAKDSIIVDEVTYTGLISGKTYELSGEVRVKPEGSVTGFEEAPAVPAKIIDAKGKGSVSINDGKVIFIPAGNEGEIVDGILLVSFEVDASDLAGEEVIVGETLWHNGVQIAVHRDINDERQSVMIPYGETIAIDTSTGIKNTLAADNRVFKDTFRYENLLPGETYRLTGKVMAGNGEEGNALLEEIPSVMTDQDGLPVENGYVEFVPEDADGSLDIYFSIDASDLGNRDVTVFERVSLNSKPVIVHEVLDGTQTVYVPDGRTTAIDAETREQVSMADEEARIIDTLLYKNLIPGTEYTVTGRVMRKTTGKEIDSTLSEAFFAEGYSGSISVADSVVTFTPDEEDGAIELTFVFDAHELAGEDTVLFERVYHNGSEVIVHENIDDEPQTIHFPDVYTNAADGKDGDREISYKGNATVVDKVDYTNVKPGIRYAVSGILMDKSTGKAVKAGGKEITGETEFTAGSGNGTVKVTFTFDSSKIKEGDYVVFETLYEIDEQTGDRHAVGSHRDLNDAAQTVKRSGPPAPPVVTRTGDDSNEAVLVIILLAAVAGIAGMFMKRKTP